MQMYLNKFQCNPCVKGNVAEPVGLTQIYSGGKNHAHIDTQITSNFAHRSHSAFRLVNFSFQYKIIDFISICQ